MDLLKTLLVYMTLVLSSGTGVDPAVTPLTPDTIPTPTPYVTMAPTAVPTAEPTQEAYTTLTMGDRGEAVTRLQLRLKELGYLSGSADGIYGSQTRTAVRNFQSAVGLTADGVAGPRTQQLLYGTSAAVTVTYVDQNGALLRQITREMTASGIIYADTGLLSGSYRIVGSTSWQINVTNGVASPSSVVFTCAATVTAQPTAAPTALTSAVTVPVRYVDRDGTVLYTDYSVQLYRSGVIYANSSRVPAGYTLVSNASQYVVISNRVATPSYVTFTYSAPVTQAPTATPVSTAYVTVRYCDENGALLATDSVALISNSTIYPRSALVPSGYILNGTGSAYIIVSGGTATPSTVTFYYKKSVTAAPEGYVTVYYKDQYGAILNTDVVAVTKSAYVYAKEAMVPSGYSITSANKQWVRYNSGNPSPSSVTFTYQGGSVTAPPVTQVKVPVYYQDQNGTILMTTSQVLSSSSYVYANDSLVPAGYVRTSSASRYVTVTNGLASPTAVTFTYRYSVTASPTATPLPQVRVPVYYRDQNGTVLATDTQVLTASGYITANDSLVPAGYARTSSAYSYVMITNGAASPSSVTFTYRYSVTAAPTAAAVNVPVYYQDQYGNTLATEVQTLTASRYVNANDSLVPSGYTRTSSSYRYVTVTNGTASPSSVTFVYKLNATATPVPQVNVPVYYVDQYGSTLATEVQTLLSSGYIYPKDSMVPSNYTRTSANRVYVTVQNGTASPSAVSFTYKLNATATPVPQAKVTVYYVDESSSVIATDLAVMTASGNIYANDALVPSGYTRTSAASSYVTVTNGKASPSSVTFTYRKPATPTPVPQVKVPVYYVDETNVFLASDQVVLSASGNVYANDALVPSGYTRTSPASSYVTVSNGKASPSSVTFTYRKPATPTPVPQVSVTVYYKDSTSGSVLSSETVTLTSSGQVYANSGMVPSGYTLVGNNSAYVTISGGRADPATVIFTYAAPATPSPVPQVNVPVYYQDMNGSLLNSTQVTLTASGYIYADNAMAPGSYELVSDAQVYVEVSGGKASPSSVTFTYRNAATPTPEPIETVYVTVVYREMNAGVLYSTQVAITGGGYVYADSSMVPAGYVLTGSDNYWIGIENHAASPSEVEFLYVNASTPTPTDAPAPVTEAPTAQPAPAPSGKLTQMGNVSLNGSGTNVVWYYDANGRPVANFYDLLIAMDENKYNVRAGNPTQEVHARLNGVTVTLSFQPDGSMDYWVNNEQLDPVTNAAIYPVIVENKPYVPFELFTYIGGYDYQIGGNTLNLIY